MSLLSFLFNSFHSLTCTQKKEKEWEEKKIVLQMTSCSHWRPSNPQCLLPAQSRGLGLLSRGPGTVGHDKFCLLKRDHSWRVSRSAILMLPSVCGQMSHTNWWETGLLPTGQLGGPLAETCRETTIYPWVTKGRVVRPYNDIPNHTVCLMLMAPSFSNVHCGSSISMKPGRVCFWRLQWRTLDSKLDPFPHGRISQQWQWKLNPTLPNY